MATSLYFMRQIVIFQFTLVSLNIYSPRPIENIIIYPNLRNFFALTVSKALIIRHVEMRGVVAIVFRKTRSF